MGASNTVGKMCGQGRAWCETRVASVAHLEKYQYTINFIKPRPCPEKLTKGHEVETNAKTTSNIRQGERNRGGLTKNGQLSSVVRDEKFWPLVGPGGQEYGALY